MNALSSILFAGCIILVGCFVAFAMGYLAGMVGKSGSHSKKYSVKNQHFINKTF